MKVEFKSLPIEVQEEVKKDLGGYDETNVIFANGKYNVSPSIMICDKYPSDYKFIGTYRATEIFTKEDHIIAQILYFGYSPTYNINFCRNKNAWNENAKKYEQYRNQYIEGRIKHWIATFNEEPSIERIANW